MGYAALGGRESRCPRLFCRNLHAPNPSSTMTLPNRDAFEIPADIAYLNCAFMSPQSRAVSAAGRKALERKAHPWQVGPADFFAESEDTRAAFARVLGGRADDVALVPSASYGLSLASACLPLRPDGTVVLLAEQFPSNVYPWRERAAEVGAEIVTVPRPIEGGWTAPLLDAIDERCGVVALPEVHWTDGTRIDLVAVGDRCRAVGAALVLDLTQSLGAMPFDLSGVQPDFVACAGYKWLLGPYSTAYLWVHPRHQGAKPLEAGWIVRKESEDFASLVEYRDEYQPGARRFDVGERSNFALLPMALEALSGLLEWGVDPIADHVGGLTSRAAEGARALGLSVPPDSERGPHILGIDFENGVPDGLLGTLAQERIFVSQRGHSLRVAPHVYNDSGDIDRLLAVLERAL